MRFEFAKELACPVCRARVGLQSREEREGEIWTGTLRCPECGREYTIVDGIPRLLPEVEPTADRVWEGLHSRVDYAGVVRELERRYALPEDVLLDYYAHAALLRAQGGVAGRVLEIGAGSGSYSLALNRLAGVRVFCLLDVSASALAGARSIFKAFGLQADLVQGDIRSLPFLDRAFALSLSGGLIEHFPEAVQRAVVAEHCRVASRTLIQAPAATVAYWTFRALYSLRPGGWPFGYERPVSRGKLENLLAGAGSTPVAWSNHDFAAGLELFGRLRLDTFPRLHRWPLLARLTRQDWIVLAQSSRSRGPA